MSIVPISDKAPACFGICCSRRRECARYAAIETTPVDHTIASCGIGSDEQPLFVALEKEPT